MQTLWVTCRESVHTLRISSSGSAAGENSTRQKRTPSRDGPSWVVATICTWTNKRMNGGWELFCRINYSKQANDRK